MVGLNESEVDVQSPSTSKMYVKKQNRKIENSFESSENNNLRTKRPYSPTISKKLKSKSIKNETSFENKLISYLQYIIDHKKKLTLTNCSYYHCCHKLNNSHRTKKLNYVFIFK